MSEMKRWAIYYGPSAESRRGGVVVMDAETSFTEAQEQADEMRSQGHRGLRVAEAPTDHTDKKGHWYTS